MPVEDEIRAFAHSLADDFDSLFADLGDMAATVQARLGEDNTGRWRWGPFQPRQIELIETEAERLLARHRLIAGSGAIFDPERIMAPEQLIPWRVRGKGASSEPYGFDFDEHSRGYYDFMELPWFSAPKATGKPKLTAPYVDFLGVDEYILTAAVPFSDAFGFIGVAGADIEVTTLERVIMRAAKRVSGPFVLLGEEGRIVASTTAKFLPGELLGQSTHRDNILHLPSAVPTLSLYWE